jgi:hypothetical protein
VRDDEVLIVPADAEAIAQERTAQGIGKA